MQNANSRPLGRSGRYGAKDLDTVNIKHIHIHFVNSNDDMSQLQKYFLMQKIYNTAHTTKGKRNKRHEG